MALPFPKMTKSPLIENPHGTVEEKKLSWHVSVTNIDTHISFFFLGHFNPINLYGPGLELQYGPTTGQRQEER